MIKVYVSGSHDPFYNLALESSLFQEFNSIEPILFFWVNRPCVILGRFQNPWSECDPGFLVQHDIDLVRRRSGGGAVYHDEGNLNFTFITSRPEFKKSTMLTIITTALMDLGITAEINDRNDLLCRGKKFSGSAYKFKKDRALHHGTLLIDSDLNQLKKVLKPVLDEQSHKGVKSVSSRTINLKSVINTISIDRIIDEIIKHVSMKFNGVQRENVPVNNSSGNNEMVIKDREELKSWDWIYGKCPPFEIKCGENYEYTLCVKGCIIESVKKIEAFGKNRENIATTLVGITFRYEEIESVLARENLIIFYQLKKYL